MVNVNWAIADTAGVAPPPDLAWHYTLDLMMAHAHALPVDQLTCYSPWRPITGVLDLPSEGSRQNMWLLEAVAFLGVRPDWNTEAKIAYVLEQGRDPFIPPLASPWDIQARYYIHTHLAKLYGAMMRLGHLLNRPDLEDWAVYRVRRTYYSDQPQLSSYHLAIWVNSWEARP